MPPKVKQLPQIIGYARNGPFASGRAQFDLRGTYPTFVARPSVSSGLNVPSTQAALNDVTVFSRTSAGTPISFASSARVGAEMGPWSERTERFQPGTSSMLLSSTAYAM